MAHLTTINADGSPQVTVIWIGLDGDDLVSGHMSWHTKLRNIERDPRVVLSFDALRAPGVFLNHYAVLRAQAKVQPSDDPLLHRPHRRRRSLGRHRALSSSVASGAHNPVVVGGHGLAGEDVT